jgi:hypothetical protein
MKPNTAGTCITSAYTAVKADGTAIHFSVLGNGDTFLTAKAIAKENKLKKLKFFTFVGL